MPAVECGLQKPSLLPQRELAVVNFALKELAAILLIGRIPPDAKAVTEKSNAESKIRRDVCSICSMGTESREVAGPFPTHVGFEADPRDPLSREGCNQR